jgi:hypothetical protein
LLPSSETESLLMGETSDRVKQAGIQGSGRRRSLKGRTRASIRF